MKIPKQAPLFGASNQTKITELFYDTGKLHYRFCQKSTNGTDWINEGAFEEYYQNGSLAKKGFFLNGKKNGHWKEYYENGNLANEGYYLIARKMDTGKIITKMEILPLMVIIISEKNIEYGNITMRAEN